jgi:hypothetical protein
MTVPQSAQRMYDSLPAAVGSNSMLLGVESKLG